MITKLSDNFWLSVTRLHKMLYLYLCCIWRICLLYLPLAGYAFLLLHGLDQCIQLVGFRVRWASRIADGASPLGWSAQTPGRKGFLIHPRKTSLASSWFMNFSSLPFLPELLMFASSDSTLNSLRIIKPSALTIRTVAGVKIWSWISNFRMEEVFN